MLTVQTANRLRQRLHFLADLRRGLEATHTLPPPPPAAPAADGDDDGAPPLPVPPPQPPLVAWEQSQSLQGGKRGALPAWWLPEHDLQLAQVGGKGPRCVGV